jgi:hypothetical protein
MSQIITPLLSPATSIVVRFDVSGGVTLKLLELQNGAYVPTESAEIKSFPTGAARLDFEFNVDATGNAAPDAGLLVEADAEWEGGWDIAMASVLGGQVFPFGNSAIQVTANNSGPETPSRTLAGFFEKTSTGSKLTTTGVNRTIVSNLTPKVTAKYLALWLPPGVSGQVKFPAWSAAGGKTVRVQAAKAAAKKAVVKAAKK